MIIYREDLKAFLLKGKNYCYVMYVNEAGFLQQLHFGNIVSVRDLEYLVRLQGKPKAPRTDDFNMDMQFDMMPGECGFYGRGDFREPTLLIERANGACMSRFRYLSHTIYDGAPELTGLPHVRDGGETLAVMLKDDFSDTVLILNYTVWESSSVLVRNLEVHNSGTSEIVLKKAFSFALDLPCGDYYALRLGGRWAQERIPEKTRLAHGILRLQSLRGISSHQTNPFLGMLKENCLEETGEAYGFQLIYSGSFAMTAEARSDGPIRVQGGIGDVNFSWRINSGEKFITPQVAIGWSNEGLGGLSRAYADFLREHVINPRYVYAKRPIVINNWEATYFDFNKEKLFSIIDEAGKLGIDTFVLDDGWFGKRDDDGSGLGDWVVNEKKLDGGLQAVIDRCKKNRLKFGLWFEPEMISEDSDLYRKHSDWAVKDEFAEPARSRNQLVLDFTRKEVVDYIFLTVSKILEENDISYVKWDMNRCITEYYSSALPAARQGEFMHRYVLGVYNLAERLINAFPQILFEGCASGGGRFDAGMLYYFPQIWTSDDTDAYERVKIQWGTSMCYPVSSMSCHVSACPNHQTQRMTPLQTRGAVASLGATGYELDLSKLDCMEKEEIARQIREYKQIDDIILHGDLYRLLNPFEKNYFCVMIVSKDKRRAYVVGERFRGVPCDYDLNVRLCGLDNDTIYHIKEFDVNVSGATLNSVGILLPRLSDYGSWTWHIEAADEV